MSIQKLKNKLNYQLKKHRKIIEDCTRILEEHTYEDDIFGPGWYKRGENSTSLCHRPKMLAKIATSEEKVREVKADLERLKNSRNFLNQKKIFEPNIECPICFNIFNHGFMLNCS